MEASIDSGRDTMATMSTTATGSTLPTRTKPLRVFHNGESDHMISHARPNYNYQFSIPEKESYSEQGSAVSTLQRHPPSPPVRLRDCRFV